MKDDHAVDESPEDYAARNRRYGVKTRAQWDETDYKAELAPETPDATVREEQR